MVNDRSRLHQALDEAWERKKQEDRSRAIREDLEMQALQAHAAEVQPSFNKLHVPPTFTPSQFSLLSREERERVIAEVRKWKSNPNYLAVIPEPLTVYSVDELCHFAEEAEKEVVYPPGVEHTFRNPELEHDLFGNPLAPHAASHQDSGPDFILPDEIGDKDSGGTEG